MAKLPTQVSKRVTLGEDEEKVVQKTVVPNSESESGSESEGEGGSESESESEGDDDDGEDDDSGDGESDDDDENKTNGKEHENDEDEDNAEEEDDEDGKEHKNSTQQGLELSQLKRCQRLEKSVEVKEKEKPSKRAKDENLEMENFGQRYPHLNKALKTDSLSLKFPFKEAVHLLDPHQLEDLDEQWGHVFIKCAEYRAKKASVVCRQYNWLFEAYKNYSSKKQRENLLNR